MNILIANNGVIPVSHYGGTERVIWYLGKELNKMGHQITYLVKENSYCDFARVLFLNNTIPLSKQIPDDIDIVHFQWMPAEPVHKPHIVTIHGNSNDSREFDKNTVFVSKNHAERYNSTSYVYNGLDWDDYGEIQLDNDRKYFHFLANAAWKVKNVKGAIKIISMTKNEKLKILGGYRLNFKMGFRLTLNPKARFCGMVGGEKKLSLLQGSKGLIFPVKWHEPFGLSLIESLYFGCPVFGTPYGSLPELIHEDVGFLSSNASDLATALDHADEYSRKKCYEYALDNFNSKKMAESYAEKYVTVLNGGSLNKTKPKLKALQSKKYLPWN